MYIALFFIFSCGKDRYYVCIDKQIGYKKDEKIKDCKITNNNRDICQSVLKCNVQQML